MKTVCIYGTAPNIARTPPPSQGVEVWCCNATGVYNQRLPRIVKESEWTRWFNLHSKAHQLETYPDVYKWFTKQVSPKRLVFQRDNHPDVPMAEVFPRIAIESQFPEAAHYFTCSVTWLIALAIYEGFERIELWGFELRSTKPRYMAERPCFFYWILRARQAGIEVIYQDEIAALPFEPGDPSTYTGPLYGYETKPELELK